MRSLQASHTNSNYEVTNDSLLFGCGSGSCGNRNCANTHRSTYSRQERQFFRSTLDTPFSNRDAVTVNLSGRRVIRLDNSGGRPKLVPMHIRESMDRARNNAAPRLGEREYGFVYRWRVADLEDARWRRQRPAFLSDCNRTTRPRAEYYRSYGRASPRLERHAVDASDPHRVCRYKRVWTNRRDHCPNRRL